MDRHDDWKIVRETLDRIRPRCVAKEAISTIDRLQAGWRPMSSIPKNTRVLILSRTNRIYIGQHVVTLEKNYGIREDGHGLLDNAKGWQPLPATAAALERE